MTRLTISMPEQMTAYVEARIAEGRYGNVSEFFRDLVRRDQERRAAAIAELGALLAKAEASGVGDRSMTELIEAPVTRRAAAGFWVTPSFRLA
jgi:antitoxin ParD1/3/4